MTCHEAITKINNYKSKLRVMGVPCHFDFAVRKVAEGEFIVVIEHVDAERGDEVYVPSFVSYIDYYVCCTRTGLCFGYMIYIPRECNVLFGDEGYREAFFKATAGVVTMGE